jgi:hypothetical protein
MPATMEMDCTVLKGRPRINDPNLVVELPNGKAAPPHTQTSGATFGYAAAPASLSIL